MFWTVLCIFFVCSLFIVYYYICGMFVYNIEEKHVQGPENNIFGGLCRQCLYSVRHLPGSSFEYFICMGILPAMYVCALLVWLVPTESE